jgi:hypothetical protein
MSYQLCRWYDPYPRLAFALKLLYLAPQTLKARATRELISYLDEQLGWDLVEASLPIRGGRWYDEDQQTAQAVELLRNSPESLKSRAADALLEILADGESRQ